MTTAKLGRETVAMLREIQGWNSYSIDDTIWQMAKVIRLTCSSSRGIPDKILSGIPRDRAVYRLEQQGLK